MNRNYIFILSLIMLGVIFTTFMLLTESRYDDLQVETLVDHEPVKDLVFFSSWAGSDTKTKVIESVLENFQKNYTDLNLVNKSIEGEDFLISLKTDFITGKDPDVFGLWPGSDIDLLIEKGQVQPLNQVLEYDIRWKTSFGDNGWDLVTIDDQIYGIPFEVIYEGLFVNKDIFETLNLEIPRDYEALKEAIPVIRDGGYIPIAYNATPEGSFIYQNMVISLGGKEDVENPFDEDGRIKPCFIDAMYYMRELYELGAFPENAFGLTDYDRNQLFINKEAAMIVQGSWFIGEDSVPADSEDVAVIPFPHFEESKAGERAITYGLGNGVFHISTAAWDDVDKRSDAIGLLKAVTSDEAALALINGNGAIINKKIPEFQIDAPKLYYEGRHLVESATDLVGPVDSFIDRNAWEGTIVYFFPRMLTGEISPEVIYYDVEMQEREGN